MSNTDHAKEALVGTLKVMAECELDEDLRVVAFEKVFDLVSGASRPAEAPDDSGDEGKGSDQVVDEQGPLAAIAKAAGVPLAQVETVFDLDDEGHLQFIAPGSYLSSDYANGTKEIGLALMVGRRLAGEADETPLAVVRQV